MNIKKVNLAEKLNIFTEHWSPKIIGALNEQLVKIAKVKGDFVMHKYDHEDELFYVIEGVLNIELKDKTRVLNAGEFIIIPKGIEHRPFAKEEVKILLFEPAITLSTGDQGNELDEM
ncbi:MAG: mannose-6-phosphate isomerase-like protein (cupin superfamily) [Maribacter sp.]|jgi:mannose-6-phosphate isomerase-like protein (cupin superfamily)